MKTWAREQLKTVTGNANNTKRRIIKLVKHSERSVLISYLLLPVIIWRSDELLYREGFDLAHNFIIVDVKLFISEVSKYTF